MEQRSEEWFKARKGKVTGSRVGGILGVNPYASAEDVMREMVRDWFGAEREFKGNDATRHGEKWEDHAVTLYEEQTGNTVDKAGFVVHEVYDFIGVSPDGLVGLDGGVEVKCPYWAKAPYSISEKPSYHAQMQVVMEACDLEWMDFVVYLKDHPLHVERVMRDRNWFAEALPKLIKFHDKFKKIVSSEESAKEYLADPEKEISDSRADRLAILLYEIEDHKSKLEPLQKEFDQIKRELGEEFGSFKTGFITLKRIQKKGSVDNKRLYADLGVEEALKEQGKTIDDYRSDPVISYTVNRNGDV